MDILESQVAKIELGNIKHVNSFVYVLAEKSPAGNAELYIVAELPLLNPAARESCENICLAIASALKRSYKKQVGDNAFETAIAQVNEELGKLAELGQTNWVDKLNCILAVKNGSNFFIASCGKVTAYLYRGGEFSDISCSSPKPHPLKTFENVAVGKLKLEDIVILSTTQLFNHLSIDRLRNILQGSDFLPATQSIIEILKDNAGPEIAFGTILNQQVPLGQALEKNIDLESYSAPTVSRPSILNKITQLPAAFTGKLSLPRLSLPSFKTLVGNTRILGSKSRALFSKVGGAVKSSSKDLSLKQIQNFSKTKKIFLVSVLVLILAVALEIGVSSHLKKSKQNQSQVTDRIKSAQEFLNNAQAALLYKDTTTAGSFIIKAQEQLPAEKEVAAPDRDLFTQAQNQLSSLRQKLENTTEPQVSNIGSIGSGNILIKLNNFLVAPVGTTLVSYDSNNGSISDSALLSSEKITAAVYIKDGTAVTYNGSSLLTWDFSRRQFSPPFSNSVPDQNSFAGLKYYPTNGRVYLINKATNQIINFVVSSGGLSKPVVASKNANDLSNALDLAIDGSIYVLNTNGVTKYQSGILADFHLPALFTPFSGKGKIATEIGWKNIYILDSGNNRILIIDKKGDLVSTVKSPAFTELKDFQVDEKNKTIFVLNDSSLLKVTLQ